MRLFLTGFMGSGKSSVGRALADRLEVSFTDLDTLIVERAGRSISAIFATDGESYFRKLESALLQEISSGIVALGGGTFINPLNRSVITARGLCIFLDCKLETIYKRLAYDTTRPLFVGRSREEIEKLYQERLPFYRLADLTVNVTHLSVEEAVAQICTRLNL